MKKLKNGKMEKLGKISEDVFGRCQKIELKDGKIGEDIGRCILKMSEDKMERLKHGNIEK